jgi:hypothetical protein
MIIAEARTLVSAYYVLTNVRTSAFDNNSVHLLTYLFFKLSINLLNKIQTSLLFDRALISLVAKPTYKFLLLGKNWSIHNKEQHNPSLLPNQQTLITYNCHKINRNLIN